MNWFVFWILIYLILIVYLTAKHIKSLDLETYLVNNRNTRTLPLVFTTLATFVGGGASIGLMAIGYESGFAAIGIGIAYVIGFFILSFFAKKIHTIGVVQNIYSFPHFLNKKYVKQAGSLYSQVFSLSVSGINICIFFFLLAAQFVGMASLLKFAFDIGYQTAAIISCIVVITYTAFAGLSGVIMTDMLQFIVILIMIILIFIPGIYIDTNALKLLDELPKEMLNGTFYGLLFLIGLPIFLAPSVLVRMDIWQRILAAKNQKTAKRVSIISGLGMLPFYIIFPLVGMAFRVSTETEIEPKYVAFLFLEKHCNEFVLGFGVVGLLAALMSSGDSFLNIISISAVKDFLGWRKEKKISSAKFTQAKIRIATFVFGIIGMLLSLIFPKIVDLMVVGIGTIVIFVPITLLAFIKKDVYGYRFAAISSILSGFLVNLAFFIFGIINPEKFEPKASFIPAFIVAAIVMIIGILFSKKDNSMSET